ncbi:hypothetical protein GCM10027343_19650 [Noviherbaspirillum agri]
MSRIKTTLAALAAKNKKGLIPFITAGDPAPELTVPLMHALVAGGSDIIELGVPFSDPMADGPVIPALESSHALAYAAKFAATLPKDKIILANLSGRGDKDMHTVAERMKKKL